MVGQIVRRGKGKYWWGASDEEIKLALWSLKAFKASGQDGLYAGFFQRFWLIVGSLMIEVVKKMFAERKVIWRRHMKNLSGVS